jgi:hypothetical protein
MFLKDNYKEIKNNLPKHVKLLAISKTKPISDILDAYNAGQILFGENKALEMRDKMNQLPEEIEWHFVGHLQTNKIKYISQKVSLIHSVDSFRLLAAIDKEASKVQRVIPSLLQFHIAKEETKFGFDFEEVKMMLNNEDFYKLKNIKIAGVMGMATFTDDFTLIRKEFSFLYKIFNEIKREYFKNDSNFCEISMGMSNDYQIAIEEGSTIIRLGSSIFGERNYN